MKGMKKSKNSIKKREETKRKNGCKHKKWSEERRKKHVPWNKGKKGLVKYSAKSRAKMSAAKLNKPAYHNMKIENKFKFLAVNLLKKN